MIPVGLKFFAPWPVDEKDHLVHPPMFFETAHLRTLRGVT